jgi:hypothetical protein
MRKPTMMPEDGAPDPSPAELAERYVRIMADRWRGAADGAALHTLLASYDAIRAELAAAREVIDAATAYVNADEDHPDLPHLYYALVDAVERRKK